jgi:hypothetical protein
MNKNLPSTPSPFLLYTAADGKVGRSTMTGHLKNVFETGELIETSVCRDFRHTVGDGKEYTNSECSLDPLSCVSWLKKDLQNER